MKGASQRRPSVRWCAWAIAAIALIEEPSLIGTAGCAVGGGARAAGVQVVFDLQTSTEDIGGATDDQITIFFLQHERRAPDAPTTVVQRRYRRRVLVLRPGGEAPVRRSNSARRVQRGVPQRALHPGGEPWHRRVGRKHAVDERDGRRILERQRCTRGRALRRRGASRSTTQCSGTSVWDLGGGLSASSSRPSTGLLDRYAAPYDHSVLVRAGNWMRPELDQHLNRSVRIVSSPQGGYMNGQKTCFVVQGYGREDRLHGWAEAQPGCVLSGDRKKRSKMPGCGAFEPTR